MHERDVRGTHLLVIASPPQTAGIVPREMNHVQGHQHQYHQKDHDNHRQQKAYKQCLHQKQELKEHKKQLIGIQNENNVICTQPFITSTTTPFVICCESDFEDVDDDQLSDLDEEEELRLCYEQCRQNLRKQPDVASQLLQFASLISADIQKFFGRCKDQEDACDVYRDKWVTTKSGRELYYADLLRIAQGDNEPGNKNTRDSVSSSPSSASSPQHEICSRWRYSGKRDASVGMGPLTELFQYGLPGVLPSDVTITSPTSDSRFKTNFLLHVVPHKNRQENYVIPMHQRKFPDSFWHEPSNEGNEMNGAYSKGLEISQHGLLAPANLPDFNDLVVNWHRQIEVEGSVPQNKKDSTEKLMEYHSL